MTTQETADTDPLREVFRVEIRPPALLVNPVAELVGAAAETAGLDATFAAGLREACAAIVTEAASRGAEGNDPIAIILLEGPGTVVLRVDDRAGTGSATDGGDESARPARLLGPLLRVEGPASVRLIRHGRSGHRTEVVARRRGDDVRTSKAPPARAAAVEPAPDDAPVEIRFLQPEEAVSLADCVCRCYGGDYALEWVYEPRAVAERLRCGVMRSVVGVAEDGQLVGHLGLNFDSIGARTAEAGQAIVDPRYRGHHLFTSLKRFAAQWGREARLLGLLSEATVAHPYSQAANVALGAHEMGLLLGYIPAAVNDRVIGRNSSGLRHAVTLYYLATGRGEPATVHLPSPHERIVRRILDAGGFDVVEAGGSAGLSHASSRIGVAVDRELSQAVVSIEAAGADLHDAIRAHQRALCEARVDCIYLDLPLANPATPAAINAIDGLGFFFGGILPYRRHDGHVLRLQCLNGVTVRRDDIAVASDLGAELRDLVCDACASSAA